MAERTIQSNVPQPAICKDCGEHYTANKVTYSDGSVTITPPRCEPCQTAHLVNGRVSTLLAKFDHVGNCSARLEAIQKKYILEVIEAKMAELHKRFTGVTVRVGGFDLANAKQLADVDGE